MSRGYGIRKVAISSVQVHSVWRFAVDAAEHGR
jgi:hypothetical protein